MVVVAAPALDADGLGDGELDVIDVLLVPERLEHLVGEAEGQDVLHGFLAEVMIDAVNLALVPVVQQFLVQLLGRGQVVAERLLDDDALPAGPFLEAGLVELERDQAEERRGHGHVEERVAAGLVLGVEAADQFVQPGKGRGVVELPGGVIEAPAEVVPGPGVELLAGLKGLDVAAHALAEAIGGQVVHGDADDGELRGQEALAQEVVQGRHEQALGQVARGTEDDHEAGVGGGADGGVRRGGRAGVYLVHVRVS